MTKRLLYKKHFLEGRGATWKLTYAGSHPRKYIVRYDKNSKDLAARIIETIQNKAKELDVEKLIEIEQSEFDPNDLSE